MNKKAFLILSLAMFSSMLGVGIISPFLPLYSQSMGATGIWIGIIFSSFTVSRLVILPFIGPLSDSRGRKVFLCTGLAFYSVICVGYILATSLFHLILVRLVQGVASAIIFPIARAYIGDLCPEGEEGKWQGYANFAFFSGFAGGPLLGGTLADWFGMTASFTTMGGLNLLAFLLALFFLPEISRQQTVTEHRPSLTETIKEMSASHVVRGLFSYRLTYALSRGSFFTFLAIFADSALGISKGLIGTLLTTHMGLMALVQPYFGQLADRFSRRAMIIIGGTINIVFLALIPMAHNYWQLLVLCALGSLGPGISLPAATAITVDEGRRFGMGTTMAMLMMAMSIGMAIGPTVSGAIADTLSVSYVFSFCAAMGVLGVVLFFWLTK